MQRPVGLTFFPPASRSRYPEIWDESYSRPGNWKALYCVLCVQCIVVIVRCIFRVCEFQQGHGYAYLHLNFRLNCPLPPLFPCLTITCISSSVATS